MLINQLGEEICQSESRPLSSQDLLAKCTHFIALYLSHIAPWCEKNILLQAQKSLCVLGDAPVRKMSDTDILRVDLAQIDELSEEDNGGFSRLFETLFDGDETVDFLSEDEPGDLKENLSADLVCLGNTTEEISVLQDIALSFSVRADAVFACYVLEGVCRFLCHNSDDANSEAYVKLVLDKWVNLSPCSLVLKKLWPLRLFVENLSVQVLDKISELEVFRLFCLWYLSRSFSNKIPIEGFTRKLLETLLAKADLAPLIVFENAGLIT